MTYKKTKNWCPNGCGKIKYLDGDSEILGKKKGFHCEKCGEYWGTKQELAHKSTKGRVK